MNERRLDNVDLYAPRKTRRRYKHIAPFYNTIQAMMERGYAPWRKRQWSLVQRPKVLEVGVGTGNKMPFYRPELEVTGHDLTPAMLERAHHRAATLNVPVQLSLGDVQSLDFPDDTFDSAIATFVFCSVPNPLLGLRELHRVVKPGGQVVLLEHMRSANRVLGALMDLLNPLIVRLMGTNINRPTLENVQRVFQVVYVEEAGAGGIVKLMVSRAE